ncbi:HD domain-containing protein [Streptomyces fumanus]|uniref:HD domain-containing protein n=1 Tax=Streptomyces fumanus TaxID=67302 RepID=UPI0033250CA2
MLSFWAGLHDLGKGTPVFQAQVPSLFDKVRDDADCSANRSRAAADSSTSHRMPKTAASSKRWHVIGYARPRPRSKPQSLGSGQLQGALFLDASSQRSPYQKALTMRSDQE